jgi:hypothetical protein
MDNYLEGIIKEIKQHKNRPKENIEKTIIKKNRKYMSRAYRQYRNK